MKLSMLNIGDKAIIEHLQVDEGIATRLKMLNIFIGSTVLVVKFSPFKSSMLLLVQGVRVAIRLSTAKKIFVQKVSYE